MQVEVRTRMLRVGLLSGLVLVAAPAHAFIAYVSNEKGNTVSVIDTESWTVTKTIKVGAAKPVAKKAAPAKKAATATK